MLDGMGREEMRAADGDRQTVADKLRVALEEGRLDLHEYDERLQQAYGAKTYGELDVLLTDLPAVAPAVPLPAWDEHSEHLTAQWLMSVWSGWFPTAATLSAIWLVSSFAAGTPTYYWPAWIVGPWAAVLLWQTVGGLATGEPRKAAEARERKAQAKQLKRERKAQLEAADAAKTDNFPRQAEAGPAS
jgi:hypothetical protein